MSGMHVMQHDALNAKWQAQLTAYHGLYYCGPYLNFGLLHITLNT